MIHYILWLILLIVFLEISVKWVHLLSIFSHFVEFTSTKQSTSRIIYSRNVQEKVSVASEAVSGRKFKEPTFDWLIDCIVCLTSNVCNVNIICEWLLACSGRGLRPLNQRDPQGIGSMIKVYLVYLPATGNWIVSRQNLSTTLYSRWAAEFVVCGFSYVRHYNFIPICYVYILLLDKDTLFLHVRGLI